MNVGLFLNPVGYVIVLISSAASQGCINEYVNCQLLFQREGNMLTRSNAKGSPLAAFPLSVVPPVAAGVSVLPQPARRETPERSTAAV